MTLVSTHASKRWHTGSEKAFTEKQNKSIIKIETSTVPSVLTKRKVKVKVELSPPGKCLIGSKSADLLMVPAMTVLMS